MNQRPPEPHSDDESDSGVLTAVVGGCSVCPAWCSLVAGEQDARSWALNLFVFLVFPCLGSGLFCWVYRDRPMMMLLVL